MSFIVRAYQKLLVNFPVGVQAIQTGLLMGSGDLIAQAFVEKKTFKKFDLRRTLRFTLIGTCFVGPSLRIWYGMLERCFGSKSKVAALKKVAADQLLFAPVFLFAIMGIIGAAQGNTVDEIKQRIKHDYPDVLLNNYKVWPAVQLCNFYIVPLQYQVLTVQFVAIIWNTYLSWKINQSIPGSSDPQTEMACQPLVGPPATQGSYTQPGNNIPTCSTPSPERHLSPCPSHPPESHVIPCTSLPPGGHLLPCTSLPRGSHLSPCTSLPRGNHLSPCPSLPPGSHVIPCTSLPPGGHLLPCTSLPPGNHFSPCTSFPIGSYLPPCNSPSDTDSVISSASFTTCTSCTSYNSTTTGVSSVTSGVPKPFPLPLRF